MTTESGHVARFTLVSRAIELLADHPGGLRVDVAAELIGATRDALVAAIYAYHTGASSSRDVLRGGYLEPTLEFVTDPTRPDADTDTTPAAFVRLCDLRPTAEAGARSLALAELDELSRIVHERTLVESGNGALAEALDVLSGSLPAGGQTQEHAAEEAAERARPFRRAAAQRRRVWISYAPEWKAGLVERVIEPYQVVHTRRGWEVDAGVVGKAGVVGTFLVAGIRSFDVRPDTFDPPPDVAARIERTRRQRPVELVVPHAARWAVEMHAESAQVLDEDEDGVRLRVLLLPPVAARLGLLLLAAGPSATVVAPPAAAGAGRNLARDLLEHHLAGPDR